MWLEGTEIDRFRLQHLIGKGPISKVYYAEDIVSTEGVVVKVMQDVNQVSHKVNKKDIDSALHEMNIIEKLMHPNILHLLDFNLEISKVCSHIYVAMPYCEQGSIIKWLEEIDVLSLQAIRDITHQVADALQYAHDNQLMHLDIKPSNILIDKKKSLPSKPYSLLADFGTTNLRKLMSGATHQLQEAPAYIAPEQWLGRPVFASDQYALAVIVYQLLTGISPFQGTFYEIMDQHLNEHPQPPSSYNSHIPQVVDAVLLQALEKAPEDRYPSVKDFAESFEHAWKIASTLPISSSKQVVSRRTVIMGLGIAAVVMGDVSTTLYLRSLFHLPYIYYGQHTITSVSWSPDSRRIASASIDGTVQVWNALDGSHAFTYRGHIKAVNAVEWSPDGTRIASASDDGTVQVWDASDGGNAYSYNGHGTNTRNSITSIAWSPNSMRVASGGEQTVQVWDASDGGNAYSYNGHIAEVQAVSWSPDSVYIASASSDNTVQVWDAQRGRHINTFKHTNTVRGVTWSPDSRLIASTGDDQTVQIWNVHTGKHVFTHNGQFGAGYSVAWSPNGKRIVCGFLSDNLPDRPNRIAGTIQIWDAPYGGNTYIFRGHTAEGISVAVAWSPDGTFIASVCGDVQVWNA